MVQSLFYSVTVWPPHVKLTTGKNAGKPICMFICIFTSISNFIMLNYLIGVVAMSFSSKNLIFQNNCKEAMKIGGGGALFNFFVVKRCPFLYLPDATLNF